VSNDRNTLLVRKSWRSLNFKHALAQSNSQQHS
jgi:hypothetical protein